MCWRGEYKALYSIHVHCYGNFIEYNLFQVVSGYMTVTLIVVTVFESHQLNELSTMELLMFAL